MFLAFQPFYENRQGRRQRHHRAQLGKTVQVVVVNGQPAASGQNAAAIAGETISQRSYQSSFLLPKVGFAAGCKYVADSHPAGLLYQPVGVVKRTLEQARQRLPASRFSRSRRTNEENEAHALIYRLSAAAYQADSAICFIDLDLGGRKPGLDGKGLLEFPNRGAVLLGLHEYGAQAVVG